jgi:hypothetical protein
MPPLLIGEFLPDASVSARRCQSDGPLTRASVVPVSLREYRPAPWGAILALSRSITGRSFCRICPSPRAGRRSFLARRRPLLPW